MASTTRAPVDTASSAVARKSARKLGLPAEAEGPGGVPAAVAGGREPSTLGPKP